MALFRTFENEIGNLCISLIKNSLQMPKCQNRPKSGKSRFWSVLERFFDSSFLLEGESKREWEGCQKNVVALSWNCCGIAVGHAEGSRRDADVERMRIRRKAVGCALAGGGHELQGAG